MASGSFNKNILLWDLATRQPLGAPLLRHTQPVQSLAFNPDGQTMASGGLDGKIILWDLRLDSWRSRACEIANRNLTPEEWNRYIGVGAWHKTCNLP
jgi:WD40 repeat protein